MVPPRRVAAIEFSLGHEIKEIKNDAIKCSCAGKIEKLRFEPSRVWSGRQSPMRLRKWRHLPDLIIGEEMVALKRKRTRFGVAQAALSEEKNGRSNILCPPNSVCL
jgi:hypothetical protein